MTDVGTKAVLLVAQGEDYVLQAAITDDYGNAVQLTGAAGMICRDANAQQIFAANPTCDPTTAPALQVLPDGYVIFTVPRTVTAGWTVGTYVWDMLVEAIDNSSFGTRLVPIMGGLLTVLQMNTTPDDVLEILSS